MRVKTEDGFIVEKTFFDPLLCSMNADLFKLLEEFNIKSFAVSKPIEVSRHQHKYNWVKGVPLIKILENPKVPWSEKEKLWKIYEDKLVQLVNELTSKRPDYFFQINHLTYFNVIKERIAPRENVSFMELSIPGIPNTPQRITFRQRIHDRDL